MPDRPAKRQNPEPGLASPFKRSERPPLPGRRYPLRLAVLGDRPARDLDATLLELPDDVNVARGLLLVFLVDQVLDALNDTAARFHGAIGPLRPTGKEELEIVDTPSGLQILATDGAANGRDVHADAFGNVDHLERLEMRDTVHEEILLNLDDFAGDAFES